MQQIADKTDMNNGGISKYGTDIALGGLDFDTVGLLFTKYDPALLATRTLTYTDENSVGDTFSKTISLFNVALYGGYDCEKTSITTYTVSDFSKVDDPNYFPDTYGPTDTAVTVEHNLDNGDLQLIF